MMDREERAQRARMSLLVALIIILVAMIVVVCLRISQDTPVVHEEDPGPVAAFEEPVSVPDPPDLPEVPDAPLIVSVEQDLDMDMELEAAFEEAFGPVFDEVRAVVQERDELYERTLQLEAEVQDYVLLITMLLGYLEGIDV